MSSSDPTSSSDLAALTAEIVSAYVSHNPVNTPDLPGMIASVHAALLGLDAPAEPEPEPLVPPVPIRKTIGSDYIISLEDGQRYKSLKRHLGRHGLTPQQYRAKWGLPSDYPMVTAEYAAQRSALARQFGLGRKPSSASADAEIASGQPQADAEEAAEKQTSSQPKARSRARRNEQVETASDQPEVEAADNPGSGSEDVDQDAASKAKPRRRSKGDAGKPA